MTSTWIMDIFQFKKSGDFSPLFRKINSESGINNFNGKMSHVSARDCRRLLSVGYNT